MHEEVTVPELTEVVARLAALLGPRAGGVQPLSGGITNRNYRVNFGGTDYVVRLPGKRTDLLGIDRDAERIATKAAAKLGIAPRVAAMLEEPPCLVTSFIDGRKMSLEELQAERIAEVARDLRAFHDSGTRLPTAFDSFRLVERYAEIATEHGAELPDGYGAALERSRAVAAAVAGHPDHAAVACHNDLLNANFLHDGQRVQILDWEYAGMGDRFFDLGNFAVNNELDEDHEEQLLEAYFGEPSDDGRCAALKLFRFMSDFREGMWAVVETVLSELDFDFDAYARKHFDRLDRTGSNDRFGVWVEEARDSSA
jgi:thiamine kinase-like enzyme